jgi:hypothetical protein
MPADVKSKAQAGFYGAIISGRARKGGPSKEQARRAMRGADVKSLPRKAHNVKEEIHKK